MPTGYTAIIEQKKDVTFEEFVWRCARAFGACTEMRDDPLDAAIPEHFEPSDYYQRAVAEALQRVTQLERMTTAERTAEGERLKHETIRVHSEWLDRERATNDRYRAMEEKAMAWEPPSAEHAGLKTFMLEQLRLSASNTGFIESALADSKTKAPGEKFADALSEARRRLQSAQQSLKEELERTGSRNQWLAQLRHSVPYPSK